MYNLRYFTQYGNINIHTKIYISNRIFRYYEDKYDVKICGDRELVIKSKNYQSDNFPILHRTAKKLETLETKVDIFCYISHIYIYLSILSINKSGLFRWHKLGKL